MDKSLGIINLHSQLFALLKLGEKISSTTNLDTILQVLGDSARDILGADRCSIFIFDEQKQELWTKIAHGVKEIRVPAHAGVVGKAALSKEVQIVIDAYNDFRFNKEVDKKTGYVTKNIIAVPLLNSRSETIGVFQALNKKEGSFTNTDAEILVLIGNYASVSLENALLYNRLEKSQIKIINKLSGAAEFKDNETSAHTKRVGLYSELIALKFGFDNKAAHLMLLTSPMHDIGKIGIADSILLKPGKLDDHEFAVMKTHVDIGYNILYDESDIILKQAAVIAKEHHEKWDGTGYPEGKSGEDISIEARITAVCDVFDALTSHRPYKEAWSLEKSSDYIRNQAGKQFDPTVAEVFFAVYEQIVAIKEKYRD